MPEKPPILNSSPVTASMESFAGCKLTLVCSKSSATAGPEKTARRHNDQTLTHLSFTQTALTTWARKAQLPRRPAYPACSLVHILIVRSFGSLKASRRFPSLGLSRPDLDAGTKQPGSIWADGGFKKWKAGGSSCVFLNPPSAAAPLGCSLV